MLKLVTAPTVEPLTVAETQDYLRVDQANDQALIASLITSSRRAVEEYTARSLINTTWDYAVTARQLVGSSMVLPRSPLASITSATYYLDDGTSGTFAATSYYADTYSTPGRMVLLEGASWPTGLRERGSLIVRFVAGYGSSSTSVPDDIRTALLMVVGLAYEERLGSPADVKYNSMVLSKRWPAQVAAILDPYRIYSL